MSRKSRKRRLERRARAAGVPREVRKRAFEAAEMLRALDRGWSLAIISTAHPTDYALGFRFVSWEDVCLAVPDAETVLVQVGLHRMRLKEAHHKGYVYKRLHGESRT